MLGYPAPKVWATLTVVVAVLFGTALVPVAGAAPLPNRISTLEVFSPAMGRPIEVTVFRAVDPTAPAPTLYLLNGALGGSDGSNWLDRTDIPGFFRDKQVNVVVPDGGAASYYTDWQRDDPVLGRNKWGTFLARELPPVIDSTFGGSGKNAIAGISMAGTSVLQLAIANPGLYGGVASYSGCAMTSDPLGRAYVKSVVDVRGRGNSTNMWGPDSDPAWVANDAYVNAAGLRGTAIYISSGSGLPGPFDTIDGPGVNQNPVVLAQQVTVGAFIESATNQCSLQMRTRLDSLGIPATYNFRDHGTHSWGYWESDMHDSWPLLASSIGSQ